MRFGLAKKNDHIGSELDLFRKNISTIFDDFFILKPASLFENEWTPVIDVKETGKEITIKAEMAGLNEKDFKVEFEDRALVISGEKKEETEKQEGSIHLSERKFGSFYRSIPMPEGIQTDKIKAEFKNGILTIKIPREAKEEAKKIKIDVK